MTNLINNAIYVTIDDVKDTTDISGLASESDSNITRFITEAQSIIDSYIEYFWTKYVSTQEFIFPIYNDDGESEIPNDIKIATVYIVEDIYLTWVPDVASGNDIKREKVGDHEVEYLDTNDNIKFIPEKAKVLLDAYVNNFNKSLL